MKFSELAISKDLLKSLTDMGFEEPTPIQQQAVPVALEGKDLIGQAQTGTGKTAAFGLPMLNKIDTSLKAVQGLVVAPTRELAIQVQEELFRIGKDQQARVYVVYGGSPIGKQIERIKRNQPQVIVGTPGRLLDLIRRKTLKLDHLQTLVLDEADEMLNMGFIDDIKAIVEQTPETRQTLLFSATMPPAIKSLGRQFLKDPVHVKVEAKTMNSELIEQHFVKCRDDEKFDIFTRLLDVQSPTQAIVFCRTKKRVDEVGHGLNVRGFNAELIHGDVTQQKRMSVINAFRRGEIEILVATDVAARGLDISGVTHVYNYDITQDPESYVHRVGRTGRAGKEGMSITFVTPNEMSYLRSIEKMTTIEMKPLAPPTNTEARQGQLEQLIEQLNGKLKADDIEHFRNSAKLLLQQYDVNDLVSALLSEVISDNSEVSVQISPQRPLPNSGGGSKQNRSRGRSGGGGRSSGGGGKRFGDRDGRGSRSSGGSRDGRSASGERRERSGSSDRPNRDSRSNSSDRPNRDSRSNSSDRPNRDSRSNSSDRPNRDSRSGSSDRPTRDFRSGSSDRPNRDSRPASKTNKSFSIKKNKDN